MGEIQSRVLNQRVIIIGGGLAGLSAGIHLTRAGYPVTVLESSSRPGGRASSFHSAEFNEQLDNGQHIIMGCYTHTLEFLDILDARDNVIYQPFLRADFILPGGKAAALNAKHSLYPLNLLTALMKFDTLSLTEKIRAARFMFKLLFINPDGMPAKSVREWLELQGQSRNACVSLWDFLSIGAMNTSPVKASSAMFAKILKEIFFKGNFHSTIILPKYDLVRSFAEPARRFIEQHGGEVLLSHRVTDIVLEGDSAVEIRTEKKIFNAPGGIVCAIPPHALKKIAPSLLGGEVEPALRYSSILTLHLKVPGVRLPRPFYGLIGSPVHWVFSHGNRLTTVMSDAGECMDTGQSQLAHMVIGELEKYFGIKESQVTEYKVIKEKRATFIPGIETGKIRPGRKTQYRNVILAGDWTDTGLPATIEGAVLSGKLAAEEILRS